MGGKVSKEYQDWYRKENRPRLLLEKKKWYLNNKERIDKQNKEYALLNSDRLKAYRREYYAKNKEKLCEAKKIWASKNKEILKQRGLSRRATEYYRINIVPRIRQRSIENRKKVRLQILKRINPLLNCQKCGYSSDIRVLHIDHINGNGNIERKSFKDGHSYYKHLLNVENVTEIYQLLCANCNWIKRYENKELFWKHRRVA